MGDTLKDRPVIRSAMEKLDEIQILRATAALLVVVHHVLLTASRYYPDSLGLSEIGYAGQAGVDIFFVISGFIMMTTRWDYFSTPRASRRFLVDRLERIVPLYWTATFIVVAIGILAPHLTSIIVAMPHVMASLFFFPLEEFPILKVGWTLNYEMYFYILFSFFLIAPRRLFFIGGPLLLLLSVGLGFCWDGEALNSAGYFFRLITDPLFFEFAFGCALGIAYKKKIWISAPRIIVVASILMMALTDFFAFPKYQRVIYWGIPAALIVYGALSYARQSKFEAKSWVGVVATQLGDSSYSLYLFHPIAIPAIGTLWVWIGLNKYLSVGFYVAVSSIACLAIGHGVHLFLEAPFMRFMKSRRHRVERARSIAGASGSK